MKLGWTLNPQATHENTLVMRRASGRWSGLQFFRLGPGREIWQQAGICRVGSGGRVRDGGPDAMCEGPDARVGNPGVTTRSRSAPRPPCGGR